MSYSQTFWDDTYLRYNTLYNYIFSLCIKLRPLHWNILCTAFMGKVSVYVTKGMTRVQYSSK